jgi:hypothetical protein
MLLVSGICQLKIYECYIQTIRAVFGEINPRICFPPACKCFFFLINGAVAQVNCLFGRSIRRRTIRVRLRITLKY